MKAVLVFVSLAILSTSLAVGPSLTVGRSFRDINIFRALACKDQFPNVFHEDPISDENKCYFKCLLKAAEVYQGGKLNMDKIYPYVVEHVGADLADEAMEEISEIKGKNDCDTALQIMHYILID